MQGQTPSYILTSLIAPPTASALTSLANAKDDLGIPQTDTSTDTWLTRAIAQESAAIARYCNRIFGLAMWRDEFRPQHGVWAEGVRAATNPLQATKWPLVASVVTFTGNTHSSSVIDGLSSTAGLAIGQLISGPGIAAGTTILAINVGALSLTLSATAYATGSAIPLSTGISVVETVAGIDTGLTAETDFQIEKGSLLPADEGPSRLYRLNQQRNPKTWPAAKIVVVYQAGYVLPGDLAANLPSDLEQCCLRLVTARYRAKGRDPMLMERAQPQVLGSERYWVGTAPGQRGAFSPEIASLLDAYRVPVVA